MRELIVVDTYGDAVKFSLNHDRSLIIESESSLGEHPGKDYSLIKLEPEEVPRLINWFASL